MVAGRVSNLLIHDRLLVGDSIVEPSEGGLAIVVVGKERASAVRICHAVVVLPPAVPPNRPQQRARPTSRPIVDPDLAPAALVPSPAPTSPPYPAPSRTASRA